MLGAGSGDTQVAESRDSPGRFPSSMGRIRESGEKPTEAHRSGLPAGLSPGFVGGAEGSADGVFPGQRVTRLV